MDEITNNITLVIDTTIPNGETPDTSRAEMHFSSMDELKRLLDLSGLRSTNMIAPVEFQSDEEVPEVSVSDNPADPLNNLPIDCPPDEETGCENLPGFDGIDLTSLISQMTTDVQTAMTEDDEHKRNMDHQAAHKVRFLAGESPSSAALRRAVDKVGKQWGMDAKTVMAAYNAEYPQVAAEACDLDEGDDEFSEPSHQDYKCYTAVTNELKGSTSYEHLLDACQKVAGELGLTPEEVKDSWGNFASAKADGLARSSLGPSSDDMAEAEEASWEGWMETEGKSGPEIRRKIGDVKASSKSEAKKKFEKDPKWGSFEKVHGGFGKAKCVLTVVASEKVMEGDFDFRTNDSHQSEYTGFNHKFQGRGAVPVRQINAYGDNPWVLGMTEKDENEQGQDVDTNKVETSKTSTKNATTDAKATVNESLSRVLKNAGLL